MAIKKAIKTGFGEANYLRFRSISAYRDKPGEISGWKQENQPKQQVQLDFELYLNKEMRESGGLPIPTVYTYLMDVDELFTDEFIARIYKQAKKHPELAELEDI